MSYSIVELFAGAGGLALGVHQAGFIHKMLVEVNKNAAKTLVENMPEWNVLCEDVRNVSYKGVVADVVSGGFSCQSFSYAGNRLGFNDTRGTLFFELARCAKELMPKIVLGENVKGLLNHDNGRTLSVMTNVLEELGYTVEYKVLRAQFFDVPQKRERLVIIGVRKDLNIKIIWPKERDYTISIRTTLNGVPSSSGQKYSSAKKIIMDMIPPGGCWRNLPEDIAKKYMGKSFTQSGGRTGIARRLDWDKPSLTLTCSPAQKQTERCHPSETRPLTIREYARIQTFPDNWNFFGSISSQYSQIGNAVPVKLGYHIGKCLIEMLDSNEKIENK